MSMRHAGVLLGASGIALMCGMDAVAKALGAHLGTFQIVFVRFAGAAVCLALWIAISRGGWPKWADMGRHAIRSALVVATAAMFFYALSQLPLAVVAALGMTAPLYVVLIGALVFRERMDPRAWTALAIGALGAGIIIFTSSGADAGTEAGGAVFAWAAALLAPCTYAVVLALMKHHSGTEEPAAMALGQSMLAALIVLPFAFGHVPEIAPDVAGLVVLIGFLGAAGYVLLISGLKRISVSAFAVIDYTSLVWAAVFGLVFFGEVPAITFWIGAALIVLACVINTARSSQIDGPASSVAEAAD